VFAPCLPESDFVAVLKTDCESGGFNLYRLPPMFECYAGLCLAR
jgi:hypothetical protein